MAACRLGFHDWHVIHDAKPHMAHLHRYAGALRMCLRCGRWLDWRSMPMGGTAKMLCAAAIGIAIGVTGCAETMPLTAADPVAPGHWDRVNITYDVFKRRVYATVVNSSDYPIVLSCTDMRRIIPARTKMRVIIFENSDCDLQNRVTYPTVRETVW